MRHRRTLIPLGRQSVCGSRSPCDVISACTGETGREPSCHRRRGLCCRWVEMGDGYAGHVWLESREGNWICARSCPPPPPPIFDRFPFDWFANRNCWPDRTRAIAATNRLLVVCCNCRARLPATICVDGCAYVCALAVPLLTLVHGEQIISQVFRLSTFANSIALSCCDSINIDLSQD